MCRLSNAVMFTSPVASPNVSFGPSVTIRLASLPVPFLNSYVFGENGMPSFLPPPGMIANLMSGPSQRTTNPSMADMVPLSASLCQ